MISIIDKLYMAAMNYNGDITGHEEFKEDVDHFIKLAKEAGYTDAEIRNVLAKAKRDAE